MLPFTPMDQTHGADIASPANLAGKRERRRGTTAMEYLFVLSLIFVVAMTGISYFGQETKKTADAASQAIKNATQKDAPPGP